MDYALLRLGVALLAWGPARPAPLGVTYDQRQTGEYNIHISLKDIKVIALLSGGLGGSEDYDYNYDYSEMTIKPPHGHNSTTTSTTTIKTTEVPVTNVSTTTERVVEITPASSILVTTNSPTPLANIPKDNGTINIANLSNKTESPGLTKPLNNRPVQMIDIPVQIVLTPIEILSDTKPDKRNVTSPSIQILHENNTTSPKPHTANPIVSTVVNATAPQQADCIEGFKKDRQGNCRPKARKPPQQTLLRKLIQLSHRMQH